MAKKVTITKREYDELQDTAAHMDELDARGVDNWGGYVGRYQDCEECGEDGISWYGVECPKCGEDLPEVE